MSSGVDNSGLDMSCNSDVNDSVASAADEDTSTSTSAALEEAIMFEKCAAILQEVRACELRVLAMVRSH